MRPLTILVIGCCAGFAAPAILDSATFVVTKTADTADGDCNRDCSLREAILAANAAAGADEILLPPGTYSLTRAGEDDDGMNGDLDVTEALTIEPPASAKLGVAPVVRATVFDRLFDIHAAGVTLRGLVIQEGNTVITAIPHGGAILLAHFSNAELTLENCSVRNSSASGAGGGIFVGASNSLTLIDTSVEGNYSETKGGGILAAGTTLLSARRVVIRDNDTGGDGGGLYAGGTSPVELIEAEVSGNSSDAIGGGLVLLGPTTIDSSAIHDNMAALSGGGIRAGSQLTITNSTISANTSWADGGGIYASAQLTLINSTITGNTSSDQGGGLYLGGTGSQLSSLTVTGNTAVVGGGLWSSGTTLRNSIVAGNSAVYNNTCIGSVVSDGHNLLEETAGCTITGDTASNLIGVDPLLAPLADNGGFSPTHALALGSPAIDAGNPTACVDAIGNRLLTDQRGRERAADGDGDLNLRCDIGAYEYGAVLIGIFGDGFETGDLSAWSSSS